MSFGSASITHGEVEYSYVPPEHPLADFLGSEQYVREPGKTDAFRLYVGQEARGRMRAILHSPATFEQKKSERLLAEKLAPWRYNEVISQPTLESLRGKEIPPEIQDMLYYDGMVEGDSLRLLNAIIKSQTSYPAEFWPVIMLWLRDEANHRDGYRAVYQALYKDQAERDAVADAEESDFSALKPILENPFALLLSLACDEMQTIYAYRNDLEKYQAIHPEVRAFTVRVIADEGWHLQKFLNLAATYFRYKTDTEIIETMQWISNFKTESYGRTFAFDQGDRPGAKHLEASALRAARLNVLGLLLKRLGRVLPGTVTLLDNETTDSDDQSGQNDRDRRSPNQFAI